MFLLANVPVPAVTRYFAVMTRLPGASPVTTLDALARITEPPVFSSAVPSAAVIPVPEKLMNALLLPVLPFMAAVTLTSTLPLAGTVTVTDGPTVVRSV
jgi:hypothetical protein